MADNNQAVTTLAQAFMQSSKLKAVLCLFLNHYNGFLLSKFPSFQVTLDNLFAFMQSSKLKAVLCLNHYNGFLLSKLPSFQVSKLLLTIFCVHAILQAQGNSLSISKSLQRISTFQVTPDNLLTWLNNSRKSWHVGLLSARGMIRPHVWFLDIHPSTCGLPTRKW